MKYLHSGRLLPYPQTLDLAGKACQIQMLQLFMKIHKFVIMVLSVVMLSCVMLRVVALSYCTECRDAECRYAEFVALSYCAGLVIWSINLFYNFTNFSRNFKWKTTIIIHTHLLISTVIQALVWMTRMTIFIHLKDTEHRFIVKIELSCSFKSTPKWKKNLMIWSQPVYTNLQLKNFFSKDRFKFFFVNSKLCFYALKYLQVNHFFHAV